jgi:hypothetical protein
MVQKVWDFRLPMLVLSPIIKGEKVCVGVENIQPV